MHNIIIKGVALHFQEFGSGDPVLLIPGVFGDAAVDFAAQLPELKRSFKVIVPHTLTRDFPRDFYRRDANDMAELMARLGHRQYSVIGWSDGAIAGLFMANRFPKQVERLVVCAANVSLNSDDASLFEYTRDISAWAPEARRRLAHMDDGELAPLWNQYCDRLRDVARSGGNICVDQLSGIKCACLILHGADDITVAESHARTLRNKIRNSALRLIPGAGHDFPRTHAVEVNSLLLEFLHAGAVKQFAECLVG